MMRTLDATVHCKIASIHLTLSTIIFVKFETRVKHKNGIKLLQEEVNST